MCQPLNLPGFPFAGYTPPETLSSEPSSGQPGSASTSTVGYVHDGPAAHASYACLVGAPSHPVGVLVVRVYVVTQDRGYVVRMQRPDTFAYLVVG